MAVLFVPATKTFVNTQAFNCHDSLLVKVNNGTNALALVEQVERRIDVFQAHGMGDEVI